MKNRDKLRRMTIGNKEYLWNYYYDDMDFTNYPYSYYIFMPKNNQQLKVRIYFQKYAPQMNLDIYESEGTKCFYKGEQVELNLCRPHYAKQMIEYVFNNYYSDTDIGEFDIKDGDAVLERMGYSGFY